MNANIVGNIVTALERASPIWFLILGALIGSTIAYSIFKKWSLPILAISCVVFPVIFSVVNLHVTWRFFSRFSPIYDYGLLAEKDYRINEYKHSWCIRWAYYLTYPSQNDKEVCQRDGTGVYCRTVRRSPDEKAPPGALHCELATLPKWCRAWWDGLGYRDRKGRELTAPIQNPWLRPAGGVRLLPQGCRITIYDELLGDRPFEIPVDQLNYRIVFGLDE